MCHLLKYTNNIRFYGTKIKLAKKDLANLALGS